MNMVPSQYNKYEALVEVETIRSDEDEYSTWRDFLFGKVKSEFQISKENFLQQKQRQHRYKLGQGAVSGDLTPVDGTMWTGSVLMGSNKQEMRVIFDTASDWLAVEGDSCSSCEGEVFAASQSVTSSQVSAEISQRTYGASVLNGMEFTDQVCVASNICLSDFEYFLVSD